MLGGTNWWSTNPLDLSWWRRQTNNITWRCTVEPLLKDTTDPVTVVGHTPGLCHQFSSRRWIPTHTFWGHKVHQHTQLVAEVRTSPKGHPWPCCSCRAHTWLMSSVLPVSYYTSRRWIPTHACWGTLGTHTADYSEILYPRVVRSSSQEGNANYRYTVWTESHDLSWWRRHTNYRYTVWTDRVTWLELVKKAHKQPLHCLNWVTWLELVKKPPLGIVPLCPLSDSSL